jgi:hypothetical protein
MMGKNAMTTPHADINGKPFTKRQFELLDLFLRPKGATLDELRTADMSLGPKVPARSYKTDSETLAPRVGGKAWRDPVGMKPAGQRRFGIRVLRTSPKPIPKAGSFKLRHYRNVSRTKTV